MCRSFVDGDRTRDQMPGRLFRDHVPMDGGTTRQLPDVGETSRTWATVQRPAGTILIVAMSVGGTDRAPGWRRRSLRPRQSSRVDAGRSPTRFRIASRDQGHRRPPGSGSPSGWTSPPSSRSGRPPALLNAPTRSATSATWPTCWGYPAPRTGDRAHDTCRFEADAVVPHEGGPVTIGKIDSYKSGCLSLEATQGSDAEERRGLIRWLRREYQRSRAKPSSMPPSCPEWPW